MEGLRKLHRCDVNAENRKRENTMDTKTIIVTLVCAVLGGTTLPTISYSSDTTTYIKMADD